MNFLLDFNDLDDDQLEDEENISLNVTKKKDFMKKVKTL